jgi:hypothetical protein
LPESVDDAQRVDTALPRHNLVPYEPPHGIGDHWNCFFHAWLDAWALTRFPPLHRDVTDVSELRKVVKQWLCGNYNYLLNNGTIDAWMQEYPDIATTIVKSLRPKSATREEWRIFCNGYALTGFRPRGTQARMGDNFTCIAVANLYQARVCVHIGLDQLLAFTPDNAFFCSIHLVLYCAPQWKHFRSTRPLVSASADPQLAQDNSAGLNDHTAEFSANGAGVSELARSGGYFSNGQGPDEHVQDDCEVLTRNGRAAEPPSDDEGDHSRNGCGFADGQAIDAEPPPYRARLHPATNEVIERHIETINRLLQEGKALQEDVDNFNILLDVYDCLPPRPNALSEREIWDSLDPMAPLGLPVAKRFFGQDYAGYIVGYDHKKELGSYLVRYDDGDHRHFKKGQLDEYRNYYEIMRNCSQPLVPEQPHDADDQARDPNLALFADLVTVPGTYADTVLNAGGFAFLAQLSQDNRLFVLRDHHLPTSLPARNLHRSICNATKLALSLCPLFPHGSEERATMRLFIHFLPQLLHGRCRSE